MKGKEKEKKKKEEKKIKQRRRRWDFSPLKSHTCISFNDRYMTTKNKRQCVGGYCILLVKTKINKIHTQCTKAIK